MKYFCFSQSIKFNFTISHSFLTRPSKKWYLSNDPFRDFFAVLSFAIIKALKLPLFVCLSVTQFFHILMQMTHLTSEKKLNLVIKKDRFLCQGIVGQRFEFYFSLNLLTTIKTKKFGRASLLYLKSL